MNRDRTPSVLFAIGWLFLLHALATILVGVYRCHDTDPPLTDLWAAALPRSQLCLLAMWLVLGSERLSWRICGMIAGTCFIFIVFSRLIFPGEYGIRHETTWLAQEWAYYFGPSGPGDALVKAPVLILGVAGPLLVWRVWRAVSATRARGATWSKALHWPRFQFHFVDAAIWTVTICLTLAALYRTEPYPGWFEQLLDHLRDTWRMQRSDCVYSATNAVLYVLLAFVSLWVVYGKPPHWGRVTLAIVFMIAAGYAFDLWSRILAERTARTGFASRLIVPAETLTCVAASVSMVCSLLLVRFCQVLRERVGTLAK
jgi:hypothetical protein